MRDNILSAESAHYKLKLNPFLEFQRAFYLVGNDLFKYSQCKKFL